MAKNIATARPGARVIGIGAVDVRKPESLIQAAKKCVEELGGIDFLMYVFTRSLYIVWITVGLAAISIGIYIVIHLDN
jgi:hypothetical protein